LDWKLILKLSLFGLAMGLATVFVVPSSIEPVLWLVVFVVCAYIIGKRVQSKHFLHGFLLGLVNCVWVTGSHVLFFSRYLANHPKEAAMMANMPLAISPRLMMAVVGGPVAGVISGIVIGVLALIVGKIYKQPQAA